MPDEFVVNGLRLPDLLITLLQQGKWQHPGNEFLLKIVPFFEYRVDFLNAEEICGESSSMGRFTDDMRTAEVFRMARGSKSSMSLELPWLDVEKAVFVAVNHIPGDDIAIVLDYRTGSDDPRVVASEWLAEGCFWREVSPTFSEFVKRLGFAP